MKISPIEIRQKTFEKNFRGYDKDEVDAFLLSLSQEWERVMDDSKEVKMKLQIAEKEVQKLRDVESTLYKTLKTAEDTGANIVEQANKSAELLTREAQINAEVILNNARVHSKNLAEEAEERAKNAVFEAQKKLNETALEIKSLETHKQNLIHELKQWGNELLDRASRITNPVPLTDFSKMLVKEEVPAQVEEKPTHVVMEPKPVGKEAEKETHNPAHAISETVELSVQPKTTVTSETSASGSFFDQL